MRELLFYFLHLPLSPAQVHGTIWDQFDQAFITREHIREIVIAREEAGMEMQLTEYTFDERGELLHESVFNGDRNREPFVTVLWKRDSAGCPQAVLSSGELTDIYSCDGAGHIKTKMGMEVMKRWGHTASGKMASLGIGYDAIEIYTEELDFFYDAAGRWISQERFPITPALRAGNEEQDDEDWKLTRTTFVYEGDALVRIESREYAQSPVPVDSMILEITQSDGATWQGRWLTQGPEAAATPRWVFYPNGLLKEFLVVDNTGRVLGKNTVKYETW